MPLSPHNKDQFRFERPILSMKTHCSRDEAAAMILGWLRGPILCSTDPPEDENVESALERMKHAPSLNGSLLNTLDMFRIQAEEEHEKAADSDVLSAQTLITLDMIYKVDFYSAKAKMFLSAIVDELAKKETSELRLLPAPTNEYGEERISLASLGEWSLSRFDIDIFADPDALDLDQITIRRPVIPQPKVKEPRTKFRQQEESILAAIRKFGHDPLALPVPGTLDGTKSGVKAKVKALLDKKPPFDSKSGFGKAWDRLREGEEIATKNNEGTPPKKD